jgi:hypothetical protein
MNIPNFHDGHFDGLRIGPNKMVNVFLKTREGKSFTLTLQEVDALILSEVKQGNIILDLVFRSTRDLTRSDMAELYRVDVDAPQATDLLRAISTFGNKFVLRCARYGFVSDFRVTPVKSRLTRFPDKFLTVPRCTISRIRMAP